MTSHRGRHRRPSRAGTAAAAAGTGLAATAIIAGASTAASAGTLPASPAPSSAEHLLARANVTRAAQPLTVTVRDGDTLSKIAKDRCGNPADWTGIFAANKGKVKDYNLIYPGQVLAVACRVAAVPQPVVRTSAVTYAPRHSAVRQAAVQRPVSSVSTAGMGGFQACVIRAESGGNPGIWNASGHWGLYQFSASTWAGHGGNPADFGRASASEQTQVFWNTVHDDGTSDWAPYDGC